MIEGAQLIEQPLFRDDRGEVRRGARVGDNGFLTFGEAYLSGVLGGVVKGWKLHTRMHSNLIVVNGSVRFVMHDPRPDSKTREVTWQVVITDSLNQRLVIPCGIWVAFQGLASGMNRILNVASIVHDPAESRTLPIQNTILPVVDWENMPSIIS